MNISSPSPVRAAGLILWILALPAVSPAESPDGSSVPRPSADLRAEASTLDGFTAALDLAAGPARLSARLSALPGEAMEARIGSSGPLWTAGPVRHSGLARVLADPCADAYLFTGAWGRPLVLDFDAPGYGAFAGGSAGVWAQDADAPRLGLWAGTPEDRGFLAGAAAAAALLPAEGRFDSWFSEEPAVPARLLAAGMAWIGYAAASGRVLAAAALSEEDRGGRGWAVRGEAEHAWGTLRWSGRISAASPGWRGLGGDAADRWELRSDASWAAGPRFRLEGRARAGIGPDGTPDWESLGRAAWVGKAWNWGTELGACDSDRRPPLRLDPALWAGFRGTTVGCSGRASWVSEGPDLTRTEVSASLELAPPRLPSLRLEGSRRWTADGPYWKAAAILEVPAARGSWTARAGTSGWAEDGAAPPWELSFALGSRFP